MLIRDYKDLLSDGPEAAALIYRCITGSQAYGTAGPASDVDYRGVYVLPASVYLGLKAPAEQVSDARNDQTYYALRRFVELANGANPNIIELMFMPKDCVVFRSRYSDRLLESRELFITKRAYESHVAYAVSQVKRAQGQNKWVHNPKPVEAPIREEFCWFIPREQTQSDGSDRPAPFRPIPLNTASVDMAHCHAAAVEHARGLYRIYHYGAGAKGIFRGESIVCESIPQEDEQTRCIGLLIFNEPAFKAALKDHGNYWEWRSLRNEQRWVTQERGEVDYDPKNMMHTLRLLLSARHIFTHGEPLVRFSGDDLNYLLRVRAGVFEYNELMARTEEEAAALLELRQKSDLPDAPDRHLVEDLLMEITAMWESDHA